MQKFYNFLGWFFLFMHAPGPEARKCLRPKAGGVNVAHYISTLYARIIQRFDVPTDRPARDLPLNHNESMNHWTSSENQTELNLKLKPNEPKGNDSWEMKA